MWPKTALLNLHPDQNNPKENQGICKIQILGTQLCINKKTIEICGITESLKIECNSPDHTDNAGCLDQNQEGYAVIVCMT